MCGFNSELGKFEYAYDFTDQTFLASFPLDDNEYVTKNFTDRINYLDKILERIEEKQSLTQQYLLNFENSHNYDLTNLVKNPTYLKLSNDFDYFSDRSKMYRSELNNLKKYFHDLCYNKYHDKTITNSYDAKNFNPLDIKFKDDLIVSSGLDIIGTQITSRTATKWLYLHIGENAAGATMADQTLQGLVASYPISQVGSFTSIGDQIRFFGAIPSTLRDADIYEVGLSTKLTGGLLLNRSTYPTDNPLKHRNKKTYDVVSIVIYMTSDQAFVQSSQ